MAATHEDRNAQLSPGVAIKAPCRLATTVNITLNGEQTIDGIAAVSSDRVFVKNQTDTTTNGLYTVSTGSWTREPDFDGTRDVVEGTIISVNQGATNSDTMWRVTNTGTIVFGTTALTFERALVDDSATITFLQSGAGAVARSVQSKGRDVVSVKDDGAVGDGATNDALFFASILSDFGAFFGSTIELPATATSYKLNSGLTIDVTKISIKGNGSKLDFTGLGAATGLLFNSSQTDGNLAGLYGGKQFFEGVFAQGPGVSAAGSIGANFTHASNSVANFSLRKVGFTGWETGANIFSNAFLISFEDCVWGKQSVANDVAVGLSIPTGGTNYGEKIVLRGGHFFNIQTAIKNRNANADIYCENVSFDYCKTFIDTNGGQIYCKNCHFENNLDTDYFFKVDGTDTLIVIDGGVISITGNKSAFQIGNLTGSPTNGGIVFKGDVRISFGANTYTLSEVITGTGRVVTDGISFAKSSTKPIVSNNSNVWPFSGTFEDANSTSALTLTGTNPPVRSAGASHSGTFSLKCFQVAGNTPSRARLLVPVKPGQFVLTNFWYTTQAFVGSGATFLFQCDWADANSNVVQAGTNISQAGTVAFTNTNVTLQVPCPAGATHMLFDIEVFGCTAGAPIAYVDDIVINVT